MPWAQNSDNPQFGGVPLAESLRARDIAEMTAFTVVEEGRISYPLLQTALGQPPPAV